jgi:endonuclease/exonuclease/phosphatase family metal-dependent hydrolase
MLRALPLRIVTYNVRYFSHATRGIASTSANVARIAHALASLSPLPDVICLQEVETMSLRSRLSHSKLRPGQTQIERLMQFFRAALRMRSAKDGYTAHYFPAHTYKLTQSTSAYTTGLAIITAPGIEVDTHNAGEPRDITHRRETVVRHLKQTRICAHVRFTHPDTGSVDLFNTHLSLPSAFAKEFWFKEQRMGFGKNQLKEVENLLEFVETARTSDRVIIVGDFNALPGSPVYQRVRGALGLRDPYAERTSLSVDELAQVPTAGFMALRFRLDHLFSGAGLRWENFDGTRPFGDTWSTFNGLSDHVPVIGSCVASS